MSVRVVGDLQAAVAALERRLRALEDYAAMPRQPEATSEALALKNGWNNLSSATALTLWRFGRVRLLTGVLVPDFATSNVIADVAPDDRPAADEADAEASPNSVVATAWPDGSRTIRVSSAGQIYISALPGATTGGRIYVPAIAWLVN